MQLLTLSSALLTLGSTAAASPLAARAALVDELVGYAAGTTGGGSSAGTTVTTCAQFAAAAKAGGVIKVSGTLKDCGIVRIPGNTSVLGVGKDAGFEGSGLQIRRVENVVVRNLKFHLAPEGKDLIDIDGSKKVWVDHCDFSSAGLAGVDKDEYDGLLDAKHGADFLTFSWNKFHDHWKGSLIGHSDNNVAEDTSHLRVTYHHNLFTNVSSRLPSIRFGTLHVYSSCYRDNPTSGINVRMGAQALVEATQFINTNRAIVTNLDSKLEGYAVQRGNLFDAKSTVNITKAGSLSTAPYTYVADKAEVACDIVAKGAGTGVVTF